MPEDLKLSQIDSSQLPPPFRGLHSPGVRKHCQIIFACYFRKSSISATTVFHCGSAIHGGMGISLQSQESPLMVHQRNCVSNFAKQRILSLINWQQQGVVDVRAAELFYSSPFCFERSMYDVLLLLYRRIRIIGYL